MVFLYGVHIVGHRCYRYGITVRITKVNSDRYICTKLLFLKIYFVLFNYVYVWICMCGCWCLPRLEDALEMELQVDVGPEPRSSERAVSTNHSCSC